MRLRHQYATLLAAALLASPLAGCGDGDPPKTAPFTPTGHIETPIPTPSQSATADAPVEPTLPDAATQATEEGARAFIAYYWDLINYAQATGDVKPLKAASSSRCTTCQTGIKGIKKLYKGGGHTVGGAYSIKFDKVQQLEGSARLIVFEALLSVANEQQTVTNPDGSEHVSAPGTAGAAVGCQWHADHWLLEVMDLKR